MTDQLRQAQRRYVPPRIGSPPPIARAAPW